MKLELQNKLYEKYPDLFIQKDLDIRQSCMPWGCEFGDGWFELMDSTCKKISDICKERNCSVEFTQTKEKFGGMRIYFSMVEGTDEDFNLVSDVISKAEDLSYTICEHCGAPGSPNKEGWITTLCESCRSKHGL